jgi:hypothetical protein
MWVQVTSALNTLVTYHQLGMETNKMLGETSEVKLLANSTQMVKDMRLIKISYVLHQEDKLFKFFVIRSSQETSSSPE